MTSVSRRAAVKFLPAAFLAGALCLVLSVRSAGVAVFDTTMYRFPIRSDGFHLDRATHTGAFFDVVGRRSALFGYENRSFEAWVYPLKIVDDFALSFRLDGLPARHRRPRHHGLDPCASGVDDARLRACGVHRAADHVRAARRAGDRHPPRRGQRAAAHHHRVVPAPAQADVAGAVDDGRPFLGR